MRLLDSGRDADVFAHGEKLVLRRYRDGRSARQEADVMRHLAHVGYPVPAITEDDGPDIVMTWVRGPTLASAIQSGRVPPSAAGEMLAVLLMQLHELTRTSADAVLHLDMHPLNVVLTPDGPVVIDWANSRRGAPALDMAVTALTLAQVIVTPSMVHSQMSPDDGLPNVVTDVLRAYLAAAPASLFPHLDDAMRMRTTDSGLAAREISLLPRAAALLRSVR